MVNNTSHRRRGPAVRPGQHEETLASIFLYFSARGTPYRQHWRRTKSDATYSKRPLSRYSTATKARRTVLNIQNLLRITIRIDFCREVFLGECAQKGREGIDFCMQSSSTSQNDKQKRRSRPSQNRRWVPGTWASALGLLRPIAGAGIAAEVVRDAGDCAAIVFEVYQLAKYSPRHQKFTIGVSDVCEHFAVDSETADGRDGWELRSRRRMRPRGLDGPSSGP